MTRKPRIGLLPLYLKLYDDRMPDRRDAFRTFLNRVASAFEERGVETVRADICRVAPEFAAAVQGFERDDVDCIVTLHLAYSPSLESLDALLRTDRPILILDTTMDAAFGPDTEPDRIMYNHGIHGVMDLACMLRRHERPFRIVAGHFVESDVMDRASDAARAAFAAGSLRGGRVLRIGAPFAGMGDFAVEDAVLRAKFDLTVETAVPAELERAHGDILDGDVEAELARDRERYRCLAPEETHRRSVRAGLTLRRALEARGISAFSMNFLSFDCPDGALGTVPFLEASKAMERGVGYAGEGDVLTAALVGALQRGFGRTSFTEIFCPDWRGDSLFLSHMGEVNPEIAAEQPELVERDYRFSDARNPALLTCAPRPGPGVFVNLAPGPRDTFALLVSPVEILGDTTVPAMRGSVRGWIRPEAGVRHFLEEYSRAGGTHHSALLLGAKAEGVEAFAAFAGVECRRI